MKNMFKKLNKMRIGKRLKKSFMMIIMIFVALSVLLMLSMLYMAHGFNKIIDYYAYPQGDIALVMNQSAEIRSAARGVIGYETEEMIETVKKTA